MKTSFIIYAALTVVLFIAASLFYVPHRVEAATKVWVPKHTLADGTVIPGYRRPAKKPGFVWVVGQQDGSVWVPGYWKPAGPAPAGKIWVNGYWRNGKWHAGRWSPRQKGAWVSGHYNRRGRWIPGHYR